MHPAEGLEAGEKNGTERHGARCWQYIDKIYEKTLHFVADVAFRLEPAFTNT